MKDFLSCTGVQRYKKCPQKCPLLFLQIHKDSHELTSFFVRFYVRRHQWLRFTAVTVRQRVFETFCAAKEWQGGCRKAVLPSKRVAIFDNATQ